jgi:hypothetical protein
MDLLRHTGVGRDVNRHYYAAADVNDELRRPVVQALFGLLRFGNAHPAFGGAFEITASGAYLRATWTNGDQAAHLTARWTVARRCWLDHARRPPPSRTDRSRPLPIRLSQAGPPAGPA